MWVKEEWVTEAERKWTKRESKSKNEKLGPSFRLNQNHEINK